MPRNINKKPFVILGGMGPQASMYMNKVLVELAVSEFGAKNNDDFPDFIIESIPVPDFISSEVNKERALIILKEKVIQLSKMDISNISIACNTAHLLISELKEVTKVPFISMIDEMINAVLVKKVKRIGILGSPTTLQSGLYQKVLEAKGIEVVMPNEKQRVVLNSVIRNVIRGSKLSNDRKKLLRVANLLVEDGAEGIILGCTELPLVFSKKYKRPVFNSVEILARKLLNLYYNY